MQRITGILILCTLSLLCLSLIIGPMTLKTILTTDTGWFILTDVRLPRTLLATCSGCVLALSGGCLQVYFKNPLADSSILGISSMAALGAVLSIYMGFTALTPFAAIAFSGISGFLLLYCIKLGYGPRSILLIGIALSSFSGAVICLFLNLTGNPYALLEIIYWLFGSFANRSLSDFFFTVPFWTIGIALLFSNAVALNHITLGHDLAMSRGTSTSKLAAQLIIGTTLCVGPMVAITGIIGFIGLIAPHLARPFTGSLPTNTLFPTMLIGGCLSLLADITVRLLPGSINVGVITSFIGTPIFVYLLIKEFK